MATCATPNAITGGTIVSSGPYYNNSAAVYQCNTGYLLSGDPYITCDVNLGWSASTVVCSPQDTNQIDLTINDDDMPSWLAYLIAVLCALVALLIISCIIAVCCYMCGGRNGCWGDQSSGGGWCCRRNRSEDYDTRQRVCKTFPRRYEYDENGRRYHIDDLGRRCYYNHKHQLNQVKVVNYNDSEGSESVTPRTTFVTTVNEVIADKRKQPAKEIAEWKPHSNPVRNINTSTK